MTFAAAPHCDDLLAEDLSDRSERSAEILKQADAHFGAGEWQAAGAAYEQLLDQVHQTSLPASAAILYFRRALALHHEGRAGEAVDWLTHAIELDSTNAEYRYSLGRLYRTLERPEEAEFAYRESIRIDPDYMDAWVSLGVLMRNVGNLAEAETCQREAARIDPTNVVPLLNLGNVLYGQKRLEEAAACFRRVIEQNPASAEAHNNLGRTLLDLYDPSAAEHFRQALVLNPNYFEAAEGLGRSLYYSAQFDDAIAVVRAAAEMNPDDIEIQILLADVYATTKKADAACGVYERLLARRPDVPRLKCGLAIALAARGQYTKPRALFEHALQADPDDPWIQTNFALFLLRSGDFGQAWPYYEARAGGEHYYTLERPLSEPRWRGESLTGKSLLVTCEQGLGDEIMFASTYAELMRTASRCILEFDERLLALFRRSFPQAILIPVNRAEKGWYNKIGERARAIGLIDYWSPAGSLAGHLRRSAEDFPKHAGYLSADAEKVHAWKQRLDQLGPGLKVGISWRGGLPQTRLAVRSMTLQDLQPILTTKGIHAVNLQYGKCLEEITEFQSASGIRLHHWVEAIDDYDETAALVGALDLVISVCTSVVHLAGALGRPVWVMAPHVAEWRYGREGEAMIWYPSARVFRQPKPDAWSPVIATIRRELVRHLRGR